MSDAAGVLPLTIAFALSHAHERPHLQYRQKQTKSTMGQFLHVVTRMRKVTPGRDPMVAFVSRI